VIPTSALIPRLPSRSLRYAFAFVISASAIGTSLGLRALTNTDHLMLLLVAVLVVAWWTDVVSALLTAIATAVAAAYVVFDPVYSLSVDTFADVSKLVLFLTIAPAVAVLAERIRRAESARDEALVRVAELNSQLGRALDAKDEFIAMLGHELRTPLTVIAGNAELLAASPSNPEADGPVEDIRREAHLLRQSIEDLLTLARLDRGDLLPTEPVLINHLLERVVDQCRRRFPGRQIELLRETTVVAEGVPTYLRHAMDNVIANALKYSPANSPVEVRLAKHGTHAVVEVCDRGPGISREERSAVFTPFYRSRRTSGAAGGAGIGLTVTRRLMEAQGGEVKFMPRPGGGSIFRLTVELVYSEVDDEATVD
jgi:signal transduction histidine kinase